jgi:hypothetical protein
MSSPLRQVVIDIETLLNYSMPLVVQYDSAKVILQVTVRSLVSAEIPERAPGQEIQQVLLLYYSTVRAPPEGHP